LDCPLSSRSTIETIEPVMELVNKM
jgi:hypothetical protein